VVNMRVIALTVISAVMCAASASCNPFANTVVSYQKGPGTWGFENPSLALGAPVGGTIYTPDNTSIVSLGDGGRITLAFANPVYDDPKNPYGKDFIVFGNAFYQVYPTTRWQEPGFVEISPDNVNWYLVLPNKLPSQLIGGVDTGSSTSVLINYADYTPTLARPSNRTDEEFYTVPERPSIQGNPGDPAFESARGFDFVSGGGDAMDIADAVVQSAPGVPALDGQGHTIPANLSYFQYIRITDALSNDSVPPFSLITTELDAVADVAPASTIGEAKKMPSNSYVVITEAVVVGVFGGRFYVESPDRCAGIAVDSNEPVSIGDKITLSGRTSLPTGEYVIGDVMLTVTSTDHQIRPVGMPIKTLADGATYGMLVRTWGKVIDAGDGYYCVIRDGADIIKVVCDEGFNEYMGVGDFIGVTGIRTREEGSGANIVRMTDPSGIRIF
jgi:hypothetical protein